MKKRQKPMNKPVYLSLSKLQLSKIVMYELRYNYVKPKYEEKAKLCCMDTESLIVYIKTEDFFYPDIAETRFDTLNYKLNINY